MSMPTRVPIVIFGFAVTARSAFDAHQTPNVHPEDRILFRCAEKRAMPAHVIDALAIRAKALDVRHVGSPDELRRAKNVAHAEHECLRLRVRVVPSAAPR